MTVLIESAGVRAVADPSRAARLVSLEMTGLEVLGRADDNLGFDPVIDEGCYPMVPWAGRIRDGLIDHGGTTYALPTGSDGHALHGLGKDAVWTQVDDGTFCAALGEPWPIPGEATLQYEPRDHRLRITLSWRNEHELGCSLGIHPWFRRRLTHERDLEATLLPTAMVERGADGLPTGQLVPLGPHPWDGLLPSGCSTGPRMARRPAAHPDLRLVGRLRRTGRCLVRRAADRAARLLRPPRTAAARRVAAHGRAQPQCRGTVVTHPS